MCPYEHTTGLNTLVAKLKILKYNVLVEKITIALFYSEMTYHYLLCALRTWA